MNLWYLVAFGSGIMFLFTEAVGYLALGTLTLTVNEVLELVLAALAAARGAARPESKDAGSGSPS